MNNFVLFSQEKSQKTNNSFNCDKLYCFSNTENPLMMSINENHSQFDKTSEKIWSCLLKLHNKQLPRHDKFADKQFPFFCGCWLLKTNGYQDWKGQNLRTRVGTITAVIYLVHSLFLNRWQQHELCHYRTKIFCFYSKLALTTSNSHTAHIARLI